MWCGRLRSKSKSRIKSKSNVCVSWLTAHSHHWMCVLFQFQFIRDLRRFLSSLFCLCHRVVSPRVQPRQIVFIFDSFHFFHSEIRLSSESLFTHRFRIFTHFAGGMQCLIEWPKPQKTSAAVILAHTPSIDDNRISEFRKKSIWTATKVCLLSSLTIPRFIRFHALHKPTPSNAVKMNRSGTEITANRTFH